MEIDNLNKVPDLENTARVEETEAGENEEAKEKVEDTKGEIEEVDENKVPAVEETGNTPAVESIETSDENVGVPASAEEIAQANYALLVEKGVIEEGLEIKNLSDISTAVEDRISKGIEGYFAELPNDLQVAIANHSRGADYRQSFSKPKEVTFTDIKVEDVKSNPELAEKLFVDRLKKEGNSDAYIEKRLATTKDSEFLEEEALVALKKGQAEEEFNKKNKVKEAEVEAEKSKQEVEAYYTKLNNLVEEKKTLWGMDISTKDKGKLKDLMTNPVSVKTGSVESKVLPLQKALQDDPVIWAQLNYLFLKGMLGTDGKMSFLTNRAKSQATKKIDELFGTRTINTTNTSTSLLDKVSKGLRGL
ncbi:hypothetical protein KAU11_10490 [Candidatus Babeliales bacterium]|nr:hypothetical protein [Candidatus Babeliales bacterium]